MVQMKKVLLVLLAVVLAIAVFAQPALNDKEVPRPKLVVGIVVDQMRWDYLYRYYDRYGDGGFKRMLREGFSNENAYINHAPTLTAIGHSTTYTGSVPAIHGITGNDFIIQATGADMYCTQDDSVNGLGTTEKEGKMSPKNLLVSTITDELKLATNFRSKVIGISIKDRGAILPAGHFADAAYWFEGKSGKFISSDYYMKKLPDWVEKFNNKKLPLQLLKTDWTPLYPMDTYKQSIPDGNPYEGKLGASKDATFPVKTSELIKNGANPGIITSTPYGNTLLVEFAKEALINENLGKNPHNVPDFLAVSFSSPDYIGHQYAVNSMKVEDNYLRLDKDLADFYNFLDQHVGKGNYTVFMTADHGAAHNPQFIVDKGGNGGYFDGRAMRDSLNNVLKAKYGVEKLVISTSNYQIHLNNPVIIEKGLDEEAIINDIIKVLNTYEHIAYAVNNRKLGEAGIPARVKEMLINGFNLKRSGVISYGLVPQMYPGNYGNTGTTHGSWYPYDAKIPLVWFGWGINHGTSVQHVYQVDIAPTLAALLRIQEPNGNIGKPIKEVIKK